VTALLVLAALILAYVGLQALRSDAPRSAVHTVDYAADVAPARRAADFDLVAPPRLPTGWRATSVTFTRAPGAHWHLGVLTGKSRYVGLEQGDEPPTSMVRTYVDEAATRGRSLDVAGQPWATYTDGHGDLALVRRAGRTTTLVVGHRVPRSDLVSYTASLR
jgi:hypothetical protein